MLSFKDINRCILKRESQMYENDDSLLLADESITAFTEKHKIYTVHSQDIFIDTVKKLHHVATISDRILPMKAYLDLVRKLQQDDGKNVCMDDEFLAACVYLSLEVSLFSAVYCLKGLSSDFKETKMNRDVISITHSISSADVRHKLSKPNEIRGAVESNTIQTSYNRLVRRIHLHQKTPDIIKKIQSNGTKQEVMRDFGLTLTDFELVLKIAKRDKLLQGLPRKVEQDIKMKLTTGNHDDIERYAREHEMSLHQAINEVVQQFFISQKLRQQQLADPQRAANALI